MCPVVFRRHPTNFKVTRANIANFDPSRAFLDCYFQFKFTDGHKTTHRDWSGIEEVPHCFWRSTIKIKDHTTKNRQFDLIEGFQIVLTDGYKMIQKYWSGIEEVSSCFFHGHPSNFEVTRKKCLFWPIESFLTLTPILFHRCLWNDSQSLKWYRNGAMLFF